MKLGWALALPVMLMAVATGVAAERLELAGRPVQGGLLFGTTDPDAVVDIDGRQVRVASNGRFVVGFTREAPETAELTVRHADGSVVQRTLSVEQRTYDIQRIEGLPPKMVTPPPEVLERIAREREAIERVRERDTPEPLFESGWIWPTLGRITGVYGSQRILNGEPRQPHFGIDIAAPEGTDVRAPADGIVVLAHDDMYFTGGTLILDHGHGITSAFLHLAEITVQMGERVGQGDLIARVGATGRATGPHLDWRINWFDRRIDPALLVPPMPPN